MPEDWKEHELASRKAAAAAYGTDRPEGADSRTIDDVFQPSAEQRDTAKHQHDAVESASKVTR